MKEYVLQQALCRTKYPGFKVVEGRSSRKYTDDVAVAETVKVAGLDPYEQKLFGITAMTSLIGKKRFEELLSELTHKPLGKLALVSDSDKRSATYTADEDFKDDKGGNYYGKQVYEFDKVYYRTGDQMVVCKCVGRKVHQQRRAKAFGIADNPEV